MHKTDKKTTIQQHTEHTAAGHNVPVHTGVRNSASRTHWTTSDFYDKTENQTTVHKNRTSVTDSQGRAKGPSTAVESPSRSWTNFMHQDLWQFVIVRPSASVGESLGFSSIFFFFSFAAALFQRLFIATRPSLLRSAGIIKPATSSPLLIIQTCAPKPDMCRTKETQNPVRHLGSLSSPFFACLGNGLAGTKRYRWPSDGLPSGWWARFGAHTFQIFQFIARHLSLVRSFVPVSRTHCSTGNGGVQIHFAKHKFVKLTLSFTVAVRFFSLFSLRFCSPCLYFLLSSLPISLNPAETFPAHHTTRTIGTAYRMKRT